MSIPTKCSQCGETMLAETYDHKRRVREGRRVYCSKECSQKYLSKLSSERMSRTNRKYASARMTERNPMRKPEVREKVSRTLKERGIGPTVRGGNGKPATLAEVKLIELFGPLGFLEQAIVRTAMPRGSGYPQHYKIDCGNAALKIGVEADGGSHDSPARRGQDQKKDSLLTSMGWKMFRFKNEVILTQPDYVFEAVLAAILERH